MPTTNKRAYYYPAASEKQSDFPAPHGTTMGKIDTDMNTALTGSVATSRLSGTIASAIVPNLPASKITSGTFAAARLPLVTASANGAMSATDKKKLDGIPAGGGAASGPWVSGTPDPNNLPDWNGEQTVKVRSNNDGTMTLYVSISPYNQASDLERKLELASFVTLPSDVRDGPVSTLQAAQGTDTDNKPVPPAFIFTLNGRTKKFEMTIPPGVRLVGGTTFVALLPSNAL